MKPNAHRAIEHLKEAVDKTTSQERSNASTFHSAVEYHLRLKGWLVVREFQVTGRGDNHQGRIDLVVFCPCRMAIELDNSRIREKSRFKLSLFEGLKFVILRETGEVISLNNSVGKEGRVAGPGQE